MLKIIVLIVHIIVSLFMMAVILLQQGKSAGISGAIAGGAETFFGKNKARTMEGTLERLTTISAVIFIITSLILTLLMGK